MNGEMSIINDSEVINVSYILSLKFYKPRLSTKQVLIRKFKFWEKNLSFDQNFCWRKKSKSNQCDSKLLAMIDCFHKQTIYFCLVALKDKSKHASSKKSCMPINYWIITAIDFQKTSSNFNWFWTRNLNPFFQFRPKNIPLSECPFNEDYGTTT